MVRGERVPPVVSDRSQVLDHEIGEASRVVSRIESIESEAAPEEF
jgi:hypothetical protein